MHGIVGFDGEHDPDFTLLAHDMLTKSTAPHLGLSLNTTKHERCLKIPSVILHTSPKRRSVFVTKNLDTKNSRKRHRSDSSPQPSIHLYDVAPSRSLLIRNKISALDPLSTFGAQKRAYLEQKTPGRNVFVSFHANRTSKELPRCRTEVGIFSREHMPYLIARPFPPSSISHRRKHLLRAKLQLFRHHYHNQIFVFFSTPEIFFSSSSLQTCRVTLLPRTQAGGRHWRIACFSSFLPSI
jgi:hypothetical protein